MALIPLLHEVGNATSGRPIVQFKELEPDRQRYRCWQASLIEPYSSWLDRWKRLHLDEACPVSEISVPLTDGFQPHGLLLNTKVLQLR